MGRGVVCEEGHAHRCVPPRAPAFPSGPADPLQHRRALTAVDVPVPDAFDPDVFDPDVFVPDAFDPDVFVPDAFDPDAFVIDVFVPDAPVPDRPTLDEKCVAFGLWDESGRPPRPCQRFPETHEVGVPERRETGERGLYVTRLPPRPGLLEKTHRERTEPIPRLAGEKRPQICDHFTAEATQSDQAGATHPGKVGKMAAGLTVTESREQIDQCVEGFESPRT